VGQAGGSEIPEVLPPLPEAVVPPVALAPPVARAPAVPLIPPDEFTPPVAVVLDPATPPLPVFPPVDVAPPFAFGGGFEVLLEHAPMKATHAPSPRSILGFSVRLRELKSCLLGE
jgi:hypothetical protein